VCGGSGHEGHEGGAEDEDGEDGVLPTGADEDGAGDEGEVDWDGWDGVLEAPWESSDTIGEAEGPSDRDGGADGVLGTLEALVAGAWGITEDADGEGGMYAGDVLGMPEVWVCRVAGISAAGDAGACWECSGVRRSCSDCGSPDRQPACTST